MKLNNYALSAVAIIVALIAVISNVAVAVADEAAMEVESTTKGSMDGEQEGQNNGVSEPPIKLVHVLNPGEREYLSPNLIGLQNIAMTFLPKSLNFINVIDANREIVNGVRYEIILNAQEIQLNATDKEQQQNEPENEKESEKLNLNKNKDLVCRLVVLEKPWIRSDWGDKYRELQYSNCTRDDDNIAADSDTEASNFVEYNAHYNAVTRNELSTDEMGKLEAQIIPAVETPTPTPTMHQSVDMTTMQSIELETTTYTMPPPELSDNQKKWLDDFLAVGALNFEQMLLDQRDKHQQQQIQQESEFNNYPVGEEQTDVEQHESLRVKRSVLTGGQTKLDVAEAEERLSPLLDSLAAGEGPRYKIKKVHSATTQIVSGSLTRVSVDLINDKEEEEHCQVEIWSQPWLPNSNEVTIDCPNKDLVKQRLSRSTEHLEKKRSHKKRNHHSLNKMQHLFNKFQNKFRRHYTSTTERDMRLRIFKENIRIIEELNRNEMGSAKYGITEFADMTTSEYKMRTGLWQREPARASKNNIAHVPNVELPKEFDWREKGMISKVKNQGNCGSCWAFSVTGNIEGLHAVKTGVLEEYSEQELLDCDTVDSACNGGLPDNAYEAIEKIGGLELENEYPYKAHKQQCQFNKTMAHIKVKGHMDLPNNETAMAQWLIVNGPISIGINANAMQFYRGGVSHPWKALCSKHNLDHGVLIVGYGVSEYPNFKKTLPYWIVKNSWGSKWGEQGYYRVYRGDNTCGVSEMATTALLAD